MDTKDIPAMIEHYSGQCTLSARFDLEDGNVNGAETQRLQLIKNLQTLGDHPYVNECINYLSSTQWRNSADIDSFKNKRGELDSTKGDVSKVASELFKKKFREISVLVVDDEMAENIAFNLGLKSNVNRLECSGVKINSLGYVTSGQAAIDYFAQNQPEYVLMDWKMEGIDGLEATQIIRRHAEQNNLFQPKIILHTSMYEYDPEAITKKAKEAGADTATKKDIGAMINSLIELL